MSEVKGFKVFNPDWTCGGYQYEVGNTYEENVIPMVCDRGLHFCKQARDCFNYYSFDPNNKVAEVVALGKVAEEGDKCSTNKLQIVREISWEELLTLVNTGKGNSGHSNSGHSNSGDWNSGNRNSGDWNSGNRNSGNRNSGDSNSGNRNSGHSNSGDSNSGDWNSGDWNSGDWNSGDSNSGDSNSGDWSSGNRNSGDWNSGNRNSGDWNSGDWNSGNRNSGNRNSGNRNSGNWNSGNWNSGNWNQGDFCTGDFNISDHETGCFCTEEHKIRLFDQETNMTFREWRNSRAYNILCRIPFEPTRWIWSDDMTDEEKAAHPEYETTDGYLKICDTDKAFLIWWDSLTDVEKNIIKEIPNFNAEKFEQITGIKVV